MQIISIFRRSTKSISERHLSLPPGFRSIFLDQDSGSAAFDLINSGEAVALPPIQINDPDSADFGKFVFMVGYDSL